MKVSFWATIKAIVWKDLVMERHTRQILSIMLMFSIISVVVFNFALEAKLDAARNVAMGLLWVTILLSSTLGLNRSLTRELDNNTLEAVLMAPVERSAIYVGKVISLTFFTLIMEAIMLPVFIAVFNKPFWRPQVWLILVLGTFGFIAAGVLVTAMSVQTRAREVLLPVLLLPLSLPAVLAAATAAAAFMLDTLPTWAEVQFPITLVIFFDILMFTVGFLTFHFVVEE